MWNSRPWSVGWFVHYESPESLHSEHQEFVSGLSDAVGNPQDLTDTTALWVARAFAIESYAHGQAEAPAKPVHQLQVALAEQAAAIENMARRADGDKTSRWR